MAVFVHGLQGHPEREKGFSLSELKDLLTGWEPALQSYTTPVAEEVEPQTKP